MNAYHPGGDVSPPTMTPHDRHRPSTHDPQCTHVEKVQIALRSHRLSLSCPALSYTYVHLFVIRHLVSQYDFSMNHAYDQRERVLHYDGCRPIRLENPAGPLVN